jgi:hypothetical protein
VLPGAAQRAFQRFAWNALLVFNLRAAVSVLLRIFNVARRSPRDLLNLSLLVSEEHLKYRLEAVTLSLFVGGYTGTYEFVRAVLGAAETAFKRAAAAAKTTTMGAPGALVAVTTRHRAAAAPELHDVVKGLSATAGRDNRGPGGATTDVVVAAAVTTADGRRRPPPPSPWVTFTAASVAGLSFMVLTEETGSRSITLYTFARALESAVKLLCHFNVLSISRIADSPVGYVAATYAFFAAATAQVM